MRISLKSSSHSSTWGKPVVASGVVAIAAVLAASCTSTLSSVPPVTGPTNQNQGTTATTSALPTPALRQAGTFTVTFDQGYSASAAFQLGTVQHIAPMEVAGLALGEACGAVAATDAVIPWELSVTNTTPNFSFASLTPDFTVGLYGGAGQGAAASGLQNFTAESEAGGQVNCSVNTNVNGSWVLGDLQAGQTINLGGYFIVSSYFSPAQPNGTPTELDSLRVGIYAANAKMNPGAGFTFVDGGPGLQYAMTPLSQS
jgi:hypothetical protein